MPLAFPLAKQLAARATAKQCVLQAVGNMTEAVLVRPVLEFLLPDHLNAPEVIPARQCLAQLLARR